MSQYGIIYRMEFLNREGFTVRVNISPTDVLIDDADTPEIIELKGGDAPVVISASNNDEDKFTPIRSKSAKIKFRTDTLAGLDSSTFSQGGDNLWVCDIILQDTPAYIFRGFLMMADNQQPFQPDPQYVTLTATDHLAALKEAALTDLDGDNPQGKYRVADIINFCLRKTGLVLDFKVVNNLRAGSGQLTNNLTFSQPGNYFVTDSLLTKYFYVGQQITISGTASNNGTFIVSAVDNTGLISQVTLTTTITVSEAAAGAVIIDTQSLLHWYDAVYLDAKTFEQEIGVSEDCYSVLEKILGEDCFITQWLGEWWVFRVDEMEDNPVYVATFDSDGVYVSTAVGTQYDKSIGAVELFKFANADTLLRFVRPHGFVREQFDFDVPLEVPCNINFERGDFIADIGTSKKYNLDCWTYLRQGGGGDVPGAGSVWIQRDFILVGFEHDRYVVFSGSVGNFVESEGIPLQLKDKFAFTMSRRLSGDVGGSGFYRDIGMQVRLYGNDGTFWNLEGETSAGGVLQWVQSNSTWTTNNRYFYFEGDVSRDMTESESLYGNTEAPPTPVAGMLTLCVNQTHETAGGWAGVDTYVDSVTFELFAFIDGTYKREKAQFFKVTRTESGYVANRDNKVYISDSPHPLFKGSMFLFLNSAYILFPNWFNAATLGGTIIVPNQDYLHPYGYIQAFSVWNQYKGYNTGAPIRGIGINIFAGSIKNLTDEWPDLLSRFSLTDANPQTVNRYFILISVEQDWKACMSTMTVIEVYNRVIFKSYDDTFTFAYISR